MRNFGGSDVRFGSLADIAAALPNVRFTPESGHNRAFWACPLSANSGHPLLFNQLIRAYEQSLWDGEAEYPCDVATSYLLTRSHVLLVSRLRRINRLSRNSTFRTKSPISPGLILPVR